MATGTSTPALKTSTVGGSVGVVKKHRPSSICRPRCRYLQCALFSKESVLPDKQDGAHIVSKRFTLVVEEYVISIRRHGQKDRSSAIDIKTYWNLHRGFETLIMKAMQSQQLSSRVEGFDIKNELHEEDTEDVFCDDCDEQIGCNYDTCSFHEPSHLQHEYRRSFTQDDDISLDDLEQIYNFDPRYLP
ncbi:expressed unknown protein [Seminavis robusta]|uniref:Uncharacterized protein n=1 Tax=Seminavis robusta TaxID=568900 RepID=A0A9N8EKT8_9STRA|nr:expressed unknown protein [Seminavis robusta]|eukprot:Sro1093_g240430.1 n/a (188) ;mRNA; r:29153-29716